MYWLQGLARGHAIALAVIGSLLMFLGWVFAIVPTFHDLGSVWPIVALSLVAFGVVLIPPGVDVFSRSREPGQKRGLAPILISALPAVLLFVAAVAELPLSPPLRALAIALEVVGMVVYLCSWWSMRHVESRA